MVVLAVGVLTTQCVESVPAASPDTYSALCDGDGECARFCASVEHRKRERCDGDQECEARAQDAVKAQCIEGWSSSRPRTATVKREPPIDESFVGCVKREKRDCKNTCKVSETNDLKGCSSNCDSSVPLMCAHRLVKECGTADDRDACESRIKAEVKVADPSLAQRIWPEPRPLATQEPACPDLPKSTNQQLEAKVAEAAVAAAADWRATKRTDLPGDMGAIVEYEPTEANKGPGGAGLTANYARTDIITRVEVISLLGTYEQEWRDCKPLLSLTGSEADSLVFQELICGATCSGPKDEDTVFTFRNGKWSRPKALPKRPHTHQDWDGDGVPEFTFPLVSFEIAECQDRFCRNKVRVLGLQQWDGARFTAELETLRSWYRMSDVRARAKPTTQEKEEGCPVEALSAAATRYVHGILGGEPEADAREAADAIGAALDTSQCLLAWPAIRAKARKGKLPAFTAKPTAANLRMRAERARERCDSGSRWLCNKAARLLATTTKPDWPTVRSLHAKSCPLGRSAGFDSCVALAHMMGTGIGGPREPQRALSVLKAAKTACETCSFYTLGWHGPDYRWAGDALCRSGEVEVCRQLHTAYSAGKAANPALAAKYRKLLCDLGACEEQ